MLVMFVITFEPGVELPPWAASHNLPKKMRIQRFTTVTQILREWLLAILIKAK